MGRIARYPTCLGIAARLGIEKAFHSVLNKEGVDVGNQHAFQFGILVSEKNWHSYYVRSLLQKANDMGIQAQRVTVAELQAGSRRFAPDVVYNRIPTRKEESDPQTRAAKGWLAKNRIPLFNTRFFNKREVDRILRKYPETASYLPASWYVWESVELEKRLSEFGSLYLKPISGSLGEGILRLEKKGTRYLLESRSASGVEALAYANNRELLAALRRKNAHQNWIIQEEIPLRDYHGRKTDFRVHVQRLSDGAFAVTGFAAKVAAKGAVTTHVRSGGSVERGETVLAEWFQGQAGAAYDAIEEAALLISRKLGRSLDPMLGELGLDMGYSDDGRLVLFEANAKPGRSIFHTPFLRQANQRSLQVLVQYAAALHQNEWQIVAYEGVGT